MKPIKNHEPRTMAASDMADTAASHFVPLGHVAEGIVRRVHETRKNQHMTQVSASGSNRMSHAYRGRRTRRPGGGETRPYWQHKRRWQDDPTAYEEMHRGHTIRIVHDDTDVASSEG